MSAQVGAPSLHIGFHTGGFNSAYFSFRKAAEWAHRHKVRGIECGFIDGVSWNHGLGYFPHIASWEDPAAVRGMLEDYEIELSQIDAAFPISGPEGPSTAVPYVISAIRWAALAGCPMVDTTDGLEKPEGYSEQKVLAAMKECYLRIMEVAENYDIVVNIETHGYFTGRPDTMEAMLDFVDSPLLRMTFDTGNVYIAGEDPNVFLRRFVDKVAHVHVKDVAPALSESSRGSQSGIGMSHSAIGEGENAAHIRACMKTLRENDFSGAVSLECDAAGGPVMERSLDWFQQLVDSLGYEHDYHPHFADGEGGAL